MIYWAHAESAVIAIALRCCAPLRRRSRPTPSASRPCASRPGANHPCHRAPAPSRSVPTQRYAIPHRHPGGLESRACRLLPRLRRGTYTYRADGPLTDQTLPIFEHGYAIHPVRLQAVPAGRSPRPTRAEQLREYIHAGIRRACGQEVDQADGDIVAAQHGRRTGRGRARTQTPSLCRRTRFCGSVAPPTSLPASLRWRARVRLLLPQPAAAAVPTPPDFRESRTLRDRVHGALKVNPTAATALRGLMDLHSDRDVADDIVYSPSSRRHASAAPAAIPSTIATSSTTGPTPPAPPATTPLTTASAVIPPIPWREYAAPYTPPAASAGPCWRCTHLRSPASRATLTVYAEQVAIAASPITCQQYVRRDGHCSFTADEVSRSFDELLQ